MNIFINQHFRQYGFLFIAIFLTACSNQPGKNPVLLKPKDSIADNEQAATVQQPGKPLKSDQTNADPVSSSAESGSIAPDIKPALSTDIRENALPNPYMNDEGIKIKPSSKKQFKQGVKAFKKKEYLKARRLFVNLTQIQKELSGPYLNLALIAEKQKQPEAAESYFQQATEVNKKNIYAYNQYAIFLRGQGRFQEAREQLEQALEIWPDYPDGHRNLGIILDLYLGEHQQALLHYKKYQSLLDKPDRLVKAWIVDLERRLMPRRNQKSY